MPQILHRADAPAQLDRRACAVNHPAHHVIIGARTAFGPVEVNHMDQPRARCEKALRCFDRILRNLLRRAVVPLLQTDALPAFEVDRW